MNDSSASLSNSVEICFSEDNATLDLSQYEEIEVNPDVVGGQNLFNALVPLAGNVADAAAQYNHAIVKFPENVTWNDLLNRKAPGWEQFKQLGSFGKNGKFNPQAAIRQVKLSPAAVANIAFQGVSIAVGQAHMMEISKQLSEIETGITKIQQEMRHERESRIEASFRMLKDYIEHYAEYSEIPEKRQAVQNELENIRHDALSAWSFLARSLNDLNMKIKRANKLDSAEINNYLDVLDSYDNSASAIYTVLMLEKQVQLQYSSTFSPEKIEEVKQESTNYLNEYDSYRSNVQETIRKRIVKLRGKPLAIPELKNDRYIAKNPAEMLLHNVKNNASRYLPPAMRNEAKRILLLQKRSLSAAASTESPLTILAEKRNVELKKLDTIFNHATAFFVNEEKVCILIPKSDKQVRGL